MKKIKLLISIAFLLLLAACGTDTEQEKSIDSNILKVYTTVYPLSDFTEKIGGEFVETASVYPPGADEHTFEPSQKDMMELSDADLFFYIGLGLEGFVDKAESVLENENVKMVATGAEVAGSLETEEVEHNEEGHTDEEESEHSEEGHTDEKEADHSEEAHTDEEEEHSEEAHTDEEEHEEHAEEESHGHDHDVDPHVWLDPVYAKELAHSIYETLSEEMPEQKAVFKENYENLISQLDELNASFETTAANAKNKQIFVSHAAYSYWEKRYGIEQVAISGISSSDEPSQQELKKIIDAAKENNISYIIFEQNGSSRLTEVVQKEIGAEKLTLHNLGVRTQEDIDQDKDYFDLMNENIQTLQKALGSK
ncbi:metal ABC transporter solute-binding protein, Zn/Mn family [Bacillus sp. SG-1]|uniref:metal ABC transporter solute-binding protein, Zn/Mn family n=1 Tax=Bacillus sp. SG-1 TaxID=161544 RepID=UPI0001543D2F|nr:zinc ABC transporter substrate-binding protein [Bacillus sp. SG-1]EDL64981.1 YcdH [Bacillus sp. SG-1]